jgi:hypothetical protein
VIKSHTPYSLVGVRFSLIIPLKFLNSDNYIFSTRALLENGRFPKIVQILRAVFKTKFAKKIINL